MDTVRILIADYNEAFRENLAELLSARFTVETCNNGIDALALLDCFAPDILVLDIMLPNSDVFALMETAISRSTEVYVFSSFLSVPVREKLLAVGIYGMMSKNCDIYHAEYNIRAMAQRHPKTMTLQDDRTLSELLLRLGFQSHRAGYTQLLMAIPLYMKDRKQPLNKIIFAEIATKMGLHDSRSVEHSIRESIQISCDSGDSNLWVELFPLESRKKRPYPSNKVFISRIGEYLRSHREKA